VRPAALPVNLTQKSKKWYMNRVSMGLEYKETSYEDYESILIERRKEAEILISPVEKEVVLQKKKH
jgi:hypothetical protein